MTISQSHAKSTGFKHYSEAMSELFVELAEEDMLSEINEKLLRFVCSELFIDTEIVTTSQLTFSGDRVEKLVQICQQLGAQTYVSGPAAKEYLDENQFRSANIGVEWFKYADYPIYSQLTESFEPHVSVMDLLLNTGENAKKYMGWSEPP